MQRLLTRMQRLEAHAAHTPVALHKMHEEYAATTAAAVAKARGICEAYEATHPLRFEERIISQGPLLLRPPLEHWSLFERLARACGMTAAVLRKTLQARLDRSRRA